MGIKRFFLFSIFVFLLSANFAQSQTPPNRYDTLLQMKTRPTVADFEKAMTPWPKTNPFSQPSPRTGLVLTELPKVIASLELGFPGGTYAFLGRDSVYLADLVDMFYRSIGQNNRVVRLNASGSSLVEGLLVDFLATNGLSVKTIDNSPPYVIIDRTSFSQSSQSTRYLKAFYDAYQKSGKKKRDLIRKVNVISTTPGSDSLSSVSNIAAAFLREENLGFPDRPLTLQDASNFSDGALWHQPFGQFQRRLDGTVYAPISAETNDIASKRMILSELYDSMTVINTEDFRERVKASAKGLGYSFAIAPTDIRSSIKFPSAEELTEEKFSEARKALSTAVNQLKLANAEEVPNPFSTNGKVIGDWMKTHVFGNKDLKSSSYALFGITTSITAFENKKITDRDFRRLIKRVLANYPVQGDEGELFKDGMVKIYDHSPTFRAVWDGKKEYFLDETHKSGPEGSRMYSEISAHFAKKCAFILGDTGS